ncbi:MAG: hypothetical protein U5K69_07590 [Balneolaceae bacterium]|nr:hypothetical protein [Balneolaceae bacterium]
MNQVFPSPENPCNALSMSWWAIQSKAGRAGTVEQYLGFFGEFFDSLLIHRKNEYHRKEN